MDKWIDPWRFFNRECTSFVGWRMNSANGVAFRNGMRGGWWGNASHWDDNAQALGYTVDSTPAPGAIAQTDAHGGHVAWVKAVNPGGTVTVEEYNIPGGSGAYSQRTVPAGTFRYIHVKDLPPAAGDVAITGDWDGDGTTDVGVRRERVWFLNYDEDGDSEASFSYGRPDDVAITGDWDGDGTTDVGVRRERVWFLNYDEDGDSEASFSYGRS